MELDETRNDDKEYVLEQVKQKGSLLDFASDRLKDDREVVIAAVIQDGNSLEFASDRLKDDKEYIVFYKKEKGKKQVNFIKKNGKEIPLSDEVVKLHLAEVKVYQREGI